MAPTDEELLELMPQGFRDDLALVSRMASHGAGPEVQPGLFRVTLNTGALDYARAVWDRARAALAQPGPEVVGPSVEELDDLFNEIDQSGEPLSWRAYARAVLSRWGRTAPAPAGEVAELVAWLCEEAVQAANSDAPHSAGMLTWAAQVVGEHADLLERQAVPVPVASDTRYEFSVFDEDFTEQAAGSAPTYAQALSEGQHYLAQYQQDGPHTLEVRRVEVLPPGAFPVPVPAPARAGEVAELVAWLRAWARGTLEEGQPATSRSLTRAAALLEQRHPAPVPVAERLPGPEDCLDEGWAWFFSPRVGWRQAVLPVSAAYTHWLPAHALPLPSGEVG